jgi:DNA-binding MarR family transcriptional regulator
LTADHPIDRPLLGLLLRLLQQDWANDVDAALRGAGFGDIRPPHANVFPFVPSEGIQVSELAQLARVRKQTMAQAVAQLERLGYVERRPDPRDRRAQLVFLTPRGEAVRPVGVAAGHRVEEHWAELTSPDEIEALRESLQRLLARRRSEADPGAPAAETTPAETTPAGLEAGQGTRASTRAPSRRPARRV